MIKSSELVGSGNLPEMENGQLETKRGTNMKNQETENNKLIVFSVLTSSVTNIIPSLRQKFKFVNLMLKMHLIYYLE